MRNRYGVGKFAKIDMLAKWVWYYHNINAQDYGFENVEQMLKSINSKYFELNDDKTQIRLAKP